MRRVPVFPAPKLDGGGAPTQVHSLQTGVGGADIQGDLLQPGGSMSFTSALYQGAWLPCRVLEEDSQTGTLEVRVTDRTGTHDVWLRPEHVRGYTRGAGWAGNDVAAQSAPPGDPGVAV